MVPRSFILVVLAAGLCADGLPAAAQRGRQTRSELPQREIAVTFDDLPVATRAFHDVGAQERITSALIEAIRRHDIPAIGFVNERKLMPDGVLEERRVALLRRWIEAGLELGNHTYSHPRPPPRAGGHVSPRHRTR